MGPGGLTAVFGMGTGVALRVWSPGKHFQYQKGSGKSHWLCSSSWDRVTGRHNPVPAQKRIKAVKRSAVSTGQLRPLLALHTRPIDLVVFQEPVLLKAAGGLVLRRASRLDAFSVYPGRTLATQRCR